MSEGIPTRLPIRCRTILALENTVETEIEGVPGRRQGQRLALVTGATGALGPVLVRALLADGWMVRAFGRRKPASNRLGGSVEFRVGDIVNADDVARATEGVDAVFHLAGLLHNPRPGPSEMGLYEAINVGGARNVARAAAASGVPVIHFSTIAVYGATTGDPADENTAAKPTGPYATTKLRGEEAMLDAGVKVIVLRLAAAYGRGTKGNYRRLVDALRRRLYVPVGDGSNRRTLIHEEDAAQAALHAADRVGEVSGVFNVTDGTTHSVKEILAAICAALGRPEPRFQVPMGLARLVARGIGRGYLVEKYLENVEVKGDRIQAALGFSPRFDLTAGWRDALRSPERD